MTASSLSIIIADLQSSNVAQQLNGLDSFFLIPACSISSSDRQEVLSLALASFRKSRDPMFFAERLLRFGPEIIPSLLELLLHPPSAEIRTLTALLLLNKGNHAGVQVLLQEVKQWGNYGIIAAIALANAGVADHAPALINKIRDYSLTSAGEFPGTQEDEILTLLRILKQLGVVIPEDVQTKFSSPSAPTYFQRAIGHYGSSNNN